MKNNAKSFWNIYKQWVQIDRELFYNKGNNNNNTKLEVQPRDMTVNIADIINEYRQHLCLQHNMASDIRMIQ